MESEMKTKTASETSIQRSILAYLKAKGVFAFRVNTGGVMRKGRWCPSPTVTKGTADIIAIQRKTLMREYPVAGFKQLVTFSPVGAIGQFVAIEVKSAKGKLSPAQEVFKANVEKAGGIYVVARSVKDVQGVFE